MQGDLSDEVALFFCWGYAIWLSGTARQRHPTALFQQCSPTSVGLWLTFFCSAQSAPLADVVYDRKRAIAACAVSI